MADPNCVFCKIVAGKIPSIKVWEDEQFIAILDINPNTEGVTLVLSKEHFNSNFLTLDSSIACEFIKAAQKVAKNLTIGLGVKRVMLAAEGMDINHAHLKLYPVHEGANIPEASREYFDTYPGYLSTQLGPQKTSEELEEVARKIRK
jgi:histidine triad (HIT) family protein